MPFVRGESYTRDQILDDLGGEKVSYLPQRNGRIVCACLSTDSNPEAPGVILVGGDEDGDHVIERKAKILAKQERPIPIFVKRASNDWVFEGYYRVTRATRDRRILDVAQRKAGRDDVVMAVFMQEVEDGRPTYLLTWNPGNWEWDGLDKLVAATAGGRPWDDRWSCGNTRRIAVGDRLFLLRQGAEPRGIMGAGWATSVPYPDDHFDESRRRRGDTALFVNVRFDRLLDPEEDEILTLDRLRTGALESVNWKTPASGIHVKEGVAELERLWADHLRFYAPDGGTSGGDGALEGEVCLALVRHRARERWLRDKKIAEVKRSNGGRLPCQVCRFDFLKVYGEIGRDYAQVHHLKSLGDRTRPSRTLLEDLAVLCANCHAMAHAGGRLHPLDSLLA